jgi:hypothetical protein
MDPAMQQFLEAQTQLLQNLTNTVMNLQGQVKIHRYRSRRLATSTWSL